MITDVARPLDLSAEDVAKRPDVLVVESGEIELPGDVQMKNIGLPPNVVYACMAETVVLALEGRYETFTVGRNIEWEKVKEIYRLGLKHGMKLAAISGVNGVFTPEQIAGIRERAARRPGRAGRPGEEPRAAILVIGAAASAALDPRRHRVAALPGSELGEEHGRHDEEPARPTEPAEATLPHQRGDAPPRRPAPSSSRRPRWSAVSALCAHAWTPKPRHVATSAR